MTDYVQFERVEETIQMPVAAATTITAGQWVSYSTGIIKNVTNKAVNILGVALHTVDNSDGVLNDKEVTIVTAGLIKAPAVVETTATNSFNHAIAVGDRLSLGGDAGGNVDDGQGLVDAINAAGTDAFTFAAGGIVAIALTAVGAASYDADIEAMLTIN